MPIFLLPNYVYIRSGFHPGGFIGFNFIDRSFLLLVLRSIPAIGRVSVGEFHSEPEVIEYKSRLFSRYQHVTN